MSFPKMSSVVMGLVVNTRFMVMGLVFAYLSVPGAGQTECEAIHQCGVNEYCYTKTGFCASCINCAYYNRYPADNVQCATGVEDCGTCIQGYYEEILNRKERRALCTRAKVSSTMEMRATTLPNHAETDSMDINNYVVGGIVLLLIAVVTATFCVHRRRKSRRDADQRSQPPGEEQPGEELGLMRGDPPRSSDHVVAITDEIPTTQPSAQPTGYRDPREDASVPMPTAPPSYDSLPHAHTDLELAHGSLPPMHRASSEPQLHNGTETFTMTVDERKENALQQAIPFMYPGGTYANSDDGEAIENDGEVVGHHSPTLNLDDEDTTPSSWVPYRPDSDGSEQEQVPDSGNSTSHSSLTDAVGSTAHGTLPNYVRNFSAVASGLRNLPSPEATPVMDGRRRNLQSPEPLVNTRRRNRDSPEPPVTTAKKSRTNSDSTLSSNEDGEPCESDNTIPTPSQAASVNNATSAVSVMNNFIFNVHL